MAYQVALPIFNDIEAFHPATEGGIEERGAIFTRREVVDFILDLVGYTVDRPLHHYRILEPSFGHGDFLIPIVERLLNAYHAHQSSPHDPVIALSGAIRGVELHKESVLQARTRLLTVLLQHQIPDEVATRLLDAWLLRDDFLLTDLPQGFTHAVGNPPYVRQERIPERLLAEYRARYHTLYDRADLYVPFIERCLRSLALGGVLGFICSDRWMKNKYGGPLRALVARHYHLAAYIDMVDTPAFQSDVIAYPAITIIRREPPGPTRVTKRPQIERVTLTKLAHAMSAACNPSGADIVEVTNVVNHDEPWILHAFQHLEIVRRLEANYPTLEEAGCIVGIGVATGADKVYIGSYDMLDVESDRKLPLVTTKDIARGRVEWRGLGVINPFREDGSLVSLTEYPRLSQFFMQHAETIKKRHCAEKNPGGWYRTIDRIDPALKARPKLLIPDIKGDANVVYEAGRFYPHHNLYYIISDEWDIFALQAVLRSGIARLFVAAYSTQMRGGYMRFQAQYLRRIRLPRWRDVCDMTRKALHDAAASGDIVACNEAVSALYQFTKKEQIVLHGMCPEELA
ncbi:MAG TPA: TaqI-like C-terminal specificity domain-containing protein [Armatimonadota bacterium]|jgi:hypothetical protein